MDSRWKLLWPIIRWYSRSPDIYQGAGSADCQENCCRLLSLHCFDWRWRGKYCGFSDSQPSRGGIDLTSSTDFSVEDSTGPLFTKKTPSYWHRDSHYKPEMVTYTVLCWWWECPNTRKTGLFSECKRLWICESSCSILWIAFLHGRCQRDWAAVTPIKYERDIQKVISVLIIKKRK